jgi:hypothetical protein
MSSYISFFSKTMAIRNLPSVGTVAWRPSPMLLGGQARLLVALRHLELSGIPKMI